MRLLILYKVYGESMFPTFSPGQHVLASYIPYWFHNPQAGDVVIVRDPRDGRLLLKRIMKIQSKTYFVQGDNGGISTDSREFGWIKKDELIAKALLF